MRVSKYTHEYCLKSARKYKYKSDWKKNEEVIYQVARKKGWLEECVAHMPSRKSRIFVKKYTFEDCLKKALKCKTKMELFRKYPNHYHSAWRYNWLTKCTEHMPGCKYKFECQVKQFENGESYCIIPPDLSEKCNGKKVKMYMELIK